MRIYETKNNKWIVWTGTTKLLFNKQSEAMETMSKLQLAKAIIYQAQLHAKAMDENPDVLQEYWDSGITFVDDDVDALGITAAQVDSCLTLLENAVKFYGGTTPANATYRTTINSVRRVDLGD